MARTSLIYFCDWKLNYATTTTKDCKYKVTIESNGSNVVNYTME